MLEQGEWEKWNEWRKWRDIWLRQPLFHIQPHQTGTTCSHIYVQTYLWMFKYGKATGLRYLDPLVKAVLTFKYYFPLAFLESFILIPCISGRPLLQTQMHWKKQISNSSKGFWLVGLSSRQACWGLWETHWLSLKTLSKTYLNPAG